MRENDGGHNSYDVVILGGGPAGAATALALKRLDSALRIAVIERSDYSAIRIGETLPPPARVLLTELGVWEVFLTTSPRISHGTRAAWGNSRFRENEFIFSPYGPGWHVDRNVFDAMLIAEAAHRGVEVIQPAASAAASRRGTHWSLCIKSREGAAKEIRGRFVVDATGRCSWLASNLGVQHVVYDKLVGIFGFFRLSAGHAAADSYTSIEACEQGWWYSAMLPGDCIAAAFMTDADQLRKIPWKSWDQWRSLLVTAPHLAGRIGAANPLGTPALRPAASQRLQAFAGEGWLAVGDAAGTFDPLSSQGIVRGLRAGIYAARSICRYLRGRSDGLQEYAEFVEREYRKYLDSRAAYYRLEQRWPDSPFWQRRQEEIHLGPEQTLQLLSSHEVDLTRIAAHLPPLEIRSLTELCVAPRKASELLTEFHRRTQRRFSDRNVVLTLQHLISQGVLAASARTDHSSQGVPSTAGFSLLG